MSERKNIVRPGIILATRAPAMVDDNESGRLGLNSSARKVFRLPTPFLKPVRVASRAEVPAPKCQKCARNTSRAEDGSRQKIGDRI